MLVLEYTIYKKGVYIMDNKEKIKDGKTPEYIRKAVKKYEATKDKITIICNKGIKDRIKQKYGDISISAYINDLIEKDLNGGAVADSGNGQELPWDDL